MCLLPICLFFESIAIGFVVVCVAGHLCFPVFLIIELKK
jgi:hypothetical protein